MCLATDDISQMLGLLGQFHCDFVENVFKESMKTAIQIEGEMVISYH